jgi:hypothetical protein
VLFSYYQPFFSFSRGIFVKGEPKKVEEKVVLKEIAKPEAVESAPDADDDSIEDPSLPFPKATVVNMVRKHLSQGKQIKGPVKIELNLWLGKMVERVAKKMDAYPYTYVDASMLHDAIEPYEQIQEIEKERSRIIKQLESIKGECDVLITEVDRQFVLRAGFLHEYMKDQKVAEAAKNENPQ